MILPIAGMVLTFVATYELIPVSYTHQAFYSLDCNDGIENAAIGWAQPSPEDHLIEKEELAEYEELIRRLYR